MTADVRGSGLAAVSASASEACVAVVDQSTSGTKALIVSRAGEVLAGSAIAHKQHYPAAGWAEHDPVEIYANVKTALRQAAAEAGVASSRIAALAITNQRETAMLWDKSTGLPVGNAIVWQCQRTAEACGRLRAAGHEETVRRKTGLLLDPYFSATKFRWLLDHAAGAQSLLRQGRLLAGTMDSWLIWKLTAGKMHATDCTNASRTSLFNIHTLQWDDELLALFGIPRELLPEVKSCDALFGETADPDLPAAGIPISGVIGDSQAALFGQLCLAPGMAKATYGTGTSVLMNTGGRAVESTGGMVTAIAWVRGGQPCYALEGVIRTTGDTLKWLREHLGLFQSYAEMERLAASVAHNDGVYLVPAFGGLGAPYWQADARAAILGMNRATGKAHILRAALESIAYQICDVAALMRQESGIPLQELRADGGASGNGLLMAFQADMLNARVIQSGIAELSALGAVYLGGLGTGVWPSPEEIGAGRQGAKVYEPGKSDEWRARNYKGWQEAVRAVLA